MRIVLFLSLGVFLFGNAQGQGCSDAGFCTAGSINAGHKIDSLLKRELSLGISYSKGEQLVNILQVLPQLDWALSRKTMLQIKLPLQAATGELGNNMGMGDPVLSISNQLYSTKNIKVFVTGGLKFPLGKTNNTYKTNLSFPMPYQTGLGTLDGIAGLRISMNKFTFATGFQGVITQNNMNNFLPLLDSINAGDYFASNGLKRGNDFLVRIEKSWSLKNWPGRHLPHKTRRYRTLQRQNRCPLTWQH